MSRGRIQNQGSLSGVLAKDTKLSAELALEEKDLAKVEEAVDADGLVQKADEPKTGDGKLVVEEEIARGRIGWPAIKLFIGSLGGKRAVLWWGVFVANMVITPAMETFETWYLGYWASQYTDPSADVPVFRYVPLRLICCR